MNAWSIEQAKRHWNRFGVLHPYIKDDGLAIVDFSIAQTIAHTLPCLWTNRSFAAMIRSWLEMQARQGRLVTEDILSELGRMTITTSDAVMLGFLFQQVKGGVGIVNFAEETLSRHGMETSAVRRFCTTSSFRLFSFVPVFMPFRRRFIEAGLRFFVRGNTSILTPRVAGAVVRDAHLNHIEPYFAFYGIVVGRMSADFSRKLLTPK